MAKRKATKRTQRRAHGGFSEQNPIVTPTNWPYMDPARQKPGVYIQFPGGELLFYGPSSER